MTNTWFRFHKDAVNNPKVQKLSGDDFKGWVNVLCIANDDGSIPTIEDVSFLLRETKEAVSSLFHTLVQSGLLVTVDETFQIYNWNKRQYKSDTSTERVKRHRERKRNVPETPQIQNRTDSDTEQKKKTKKKVSPTHPRFEEFKTAYPSRQGSHDWPRARDCFTKIVAESMTTADQLIAAAGHYSQVCSGMRDRQGVQQAATFLGPRKQTWKEFLEPPPKQNGADTRAGWMIKQDEDRESLKNLRKQMEEEAENGQPN